MRKPLMAALPAGADQVTVARVPSADRVTDRPVGAEGGPTAVVLTAVVLAGVVVVRDGSGFRDRDDVRDWLAPRGDVMLRDGSDLRGREVVRDGIAPPDSAVPPDGAGSRAALAGASVWRCALRNASNRASACTKAISGAAKLFHGPTTVSRGRFVLASPRYRSGSLRGLRVTQHGPWAARLIRPRIGAPKPRWHRESVHPDMTTTPGHAGRRWDLHVSGPGSCRA